MAQSPVEMRPKDGTPDWAPITTGTATAIDSAVPSSSFLPRLNLNAPDSLRMLTILFFRSAPVTPETQASGGSRQNSQTFRMLSA